MINLFNIFLLVNNHTDQRGGKQGNQRTTNHGRYTQAVDQILFLWSQHAQSSQQNADRGDIGETTQDIGGHDDGFIKQEKARLFPLLQLKVGNKLIENGLLSQQRTYQHNIRRRHTDQPHKRSGDHA